MQQYRQTVQQRFEQGSPPPVQLDATALAGSPIRERNAAAAQDLLNGVKPAGAPDASAMRMMSSPYGRGGSLGHFVDTFA